MAQSYQKKSKREQRDEVQDALEACVQEGARKMLIAALEEEVNGFLERLRYQRGKEFRGYRNGYHPVRELTVGLGPVKVRVPRVAKVPPHVALQGFQSQIVKRYQRASETTKRLFARLYLEGLATGDFEPVFRELVGETTALSPNAIVRLKECWEQEYEAWRKRPLWEHRYAYVWADGVYLDAGTEAEKTALLCVVGARDDGEKELLAMEPGYRESQESWAETLRDIRNRGLEAPMAAMGDGVLGSGQLWTRSIPPLSTSDAGTIVLPTCRPNYRNGSRRKRAAACGRWLRLRRRKGVKNYATDTPPSFWLPTSVPPRKPCSVTGKTSSPSIITRGNTGYT